MTILATMKARKTSGTIEPYRATCAEVIPNPYSPAAAQISVGMTSRIRNSGSYTPWLRLTMNLVTISVYRPDRMKPIMLPTKAAVYFLPACTSSRKRGGPRKISERMTPTMTVHPMITPCIKQAQMTAGCRKRGNGRRNKIQKDSGVLRPLNGAKRVYKGLQPDAWVVDVSRTRNCFSSDHCGDTERIASGSSDGSSVIE